MQQDESRRICIVLGDFVELANLTAATPNADLPAIDGVVSPNVTFPRNVFRMKERKDSK